MLREPNKEQLEAINSPGGVILEAGAGSGKTFVIVRHLINKIVDYCNSLQPGLDEQKQIDSFLSGIVVMTFTRKAAGELQLRIRKEFKEFLEFNEPSQKLTYCYEKIDLVFVGTIDSFCKRLADSRNFPRPFFESEVLDDLAVANIVQKAVEKFGLALLKAKDTNFFTSMLITKKNNLVKNLVGIFSDPIKRLNWLNINKEFDIETLYQQIFEFDFNQLVSIPVSTESFKKKNKCSELIDEFLSLNLDTFNKDNLVALYELLSNLARFPVYKGQDDQVHRFLKISKKIRENFKYTWENIRYIEENPELYQAWQNNFVNLFEFVGKDLEKVRGFNFADVEYQCLRALESQSFASEMRQKYHYFIVDEFQDTSILQLNLVTAITNGELSKLFLVGDVKQAIYGFRGGNVKLFLDSIGKMPTRKKLIKNYRSSAAVVEFNNEVFNRVDKIYDFSKVKFNGQESSYSSEKSKIISLENPVIEDKLNAKQVDNVEAKLISLYLESNRQNQTAVLYRNLKPSFYLINELEQAELAFVAQFKIRFADCPVFGLFSVLCKSGVANEREKPIEETVEYFLENYLSILGIHESKAKIKSVLSMWETDRVYLGYFWAFMKVYKSLGLFSDKFKNSLKKISSLCEVSGNDGEVLLDLLKSSEADSLNFHYQFGTNPQIQIMTVHASKGLEFNSVVLAGIYTNASRADRLTMMGERFDEFNFENEQGESLYSIGNLIKKTSEERYDISEELRLLYVALTRAEEHIVFVNLQESVFSRKNSWVYFLRQINFNEMSLSRREFSFDVLDELKLGSPLFHRDSEILTKPSAINNFSYFPEFSVTSLVSWILCPEMFYFKHVYKLDNGRFKKALTQSSNEPKIVSTAERGIRKHQELEKIIKNRKIPHESEFSWLADNLMRFSHNWDFIPEKEIKFECGGQIISGTPDLIIKPKQLDKNNSVVKIWDYKTGDPYELVKDSYFYQLIFYAVGVCQVFSLAPDVKLELSLIYLDKNEVSTKVFDQKQLDKKVQDFWTGFMVNPTKNYDHCQSCDYNNICHYDS